MRMRPLSSSGQITSWKSRDQASEEGSGVAVSISKSVTSTVPANATKALAPLSCGRTTTAW